MNSLYIMYSLSVIYTFVTHKCVIPRQKAFKTVGYTLHERFVAIYKDTDWRQRGIMEKVCAFFGHREIWTDISYPLEQAVRAAVEDGVTVFWVGGYGTFDSLAAALWPRKTENRLFYRFLPNS